jgi:hypothetical protein
MRNGRRREGGCVCVGGGGVVREKLCLQARSSRDSTGEQYQTFAKENSDATRTVTVVT